jgi:DNA-binding PadR family transcriptional regulator
MDLTALDALLLFLVSHKGQSGYDVRQLMRATPLGLFSDSPGAIYPALARLERRGLLTSAAEPNGRRKRVYALAEAGVVALHAWLNQRLDPEALVRKAAETDLRYVMLAQVLGRAAALGFQRACVRAEADHLAQLEAFYRGPGQAMDRASREALDLGIQTTRARLQWRRALLSTQGDDP